MKKKILFLFGILFLASGCTAYYDIDISNKGITEKLKVVGSTEQETADLRQYDFYTPAFYDEQGASEENIKLEGIEYYDLTHTDDLNMRYQFTARNYNRSRLLHYCYQNVDFQQDSENILISTSKDFHCFTAHPELTALQVNVQVPEGYEMVNTNAKNGNGNLYQWNLQPDAKDNSIFLSLKKKKITSSTEQPKKEEPTEKTPSNNMKIVWLCLASFVVILFILIKWNQSRKNYE